MNAAPDNDFLTQWILRNPNAKAGGRLVADGAEIGGYVVLGLLGRGGSAEVLRVRPKGGGAAVALKVFRPNRPNIGQRFHREVEILRKRPCDSFPLLIASGEDGGRLYYVMEELFPESLPRGDRAVARLLLSLCEGVSALHRRGFVHRDIKPGNILFRKDGAPVLVDLGLALDLSAETAPPTGGSPSVFNGNAIRVGTPGFSAPEQFSGGAVAPAADVYALGVLADTCFQHRPPPWWRPLLRKATERLPAERFANADAFARAVRRRFARPVLSLAGALALTAAVAFWAVSSGVYARMFPGEAPWLFTPARTPGPLWNGMIMDGVWRLDVHAFENEISVAPHFTRGVGTLNLRKPIRDAEGREYTIVAIGSGADPDGRDGSARQPDAGRPAMTGLLLPDTLVDLGRGALAQCDTLKSVDLPESLRHIGPCAFSGCGSLRRITIPKGVDHVSMDRVFLGCGGLEAIDVAPGNEVYRSVDGVLFSREGRRLVAFPPARGGRYEVPNGVLQIAPHAFAGCRRLQEAVLPPSVAEIGRCAFAGCAGLTNVVFMGSVRPRMDPEAFNNSGVRLP